MTSSQQALEFVLLGNPQEEVTELNAINTAFFIF